MTTKKSEETTIELFLNKNGDKYNIPKVTLKALKDFGICDARVLSVLTEAEIAAIPGISEKTAVALVRAADDKFRGPLFQKASDQSERFLKKRKYFTTGSEKFDKLLGGGMPTSTIIEINGEYRTGKTQTCLTCSITAQLPEEKGGLGRPVIYIDTENSFQATHLIGIGKRFGISEEDILNNIFVVQAEQLRYLNQAIDRLPGYVQALDPGLIVIDSLMAPFRNEFHELNLLAIRQKKLGRLIGLLKRIAIAFNTSVIFTNQVMANISHTAQYFPVIATGGHVVAHASDIRIFMKRGSGNLRKAKIDDCAWLPSETTEFYITPAGISDSEKDYKPDEDEVPKTAQGNVKEESPYAIGIKEASGQKMKQSENEDVSTEANSAINEYNDIEFDSQIDLKVFSDEATISKDTQVVESEKSTKKPKISQSPIKKSKITV